MDSLPDRVPDGIEPMVGYRMWTYALGGRLAQLHSLRSMSSFFFHQLGKSDWDPPVRSDWDGAASAWVFASCELHGHVAPDEDCTCGFYAVNCTRLLAPPIHTSVSGLHQGIEFGTVLGRVELAGKIIEHEYGYRAERARIAELIPIRGTERTVMRLGARLGLPIGRPVAANYTPPSPGPTDPAPRGPSTPRRRVGDWVQPLPLRHDRVRVALSVHPGASSPATYPSVVGRERSAWACA
jgi:hypothetical protein